MSSARSFGSRFFVFVSEACRRIAATGADVDLPLCAAWKKEGVTVAGRDDANPGDTLDALRVGVVQT